MFIVNGVYKFAELDNWAIGCYGKHHDDFINCNFSAENIEGLIAELKAFCGHDDVSLDACDEVGRVDIQGYEDDEGCPASIMELQAWRDGHIDLWAVTYTFYVFEASPYKLK